MTLVLNTRQRETARQIVEELRALVASLEEWPEHEEVARVCREAGMTTAIWRELDQRPGFWGYQGNWHAALRRMRNTGNRELLASAFHEKG